MLGSQFNIHLHSDPSLATGLPFVPLPADGSRVSSGTLGFCFIFRFLFGNDGIFTRVSWPMPGSPHAGLTSSLVSQPGPVRSVSVMADLWAEQNGNQQDGWRFPG